MATTKRNAMLIEEAREKIKTTQLINRLQDHGLGEVEMSPTQVKAIEILLRKRVPDLSSVALAGGHDDEAIKVLRWATEAEATPDPSKKSLSHITQETSGDHSTNPQSDIASLLPTEEQEKQ